MTTPHMPPPWLAMVQAEADRAQAALDTRNTNSHEHPSDTTPAPRKDLTS